MPKGIRFHIRLLQGQLALLFFSKHLKPCLECSALSSGSLAVPDNPARRRSKRRRAFF